MFWRKKKKEKENDFKKEMLEKSQIGEHTCKGCTHITPSLGDFYCAVTPNGSDSPVNALGPCFYANNGELVYCHWDRCDKFEPRRDCDSCIFYGERTVVIGGYAVSDNICKLNELNPGKCKGRRCWEPKEKP